MYLGLTPFWPAKLRSQTGLTGTMFKHCCQTVFAPEQEGKEESAFI